MAARDIDRMVAANITAEARAVENNENLNANTSIAIVLFQDDPLGADALTNKEAT